MARFTCVVAIAAARNVLGSTRGSRAGDCVPVIANLLCKAGISMEAMSPEKIVSAGRRNQHASRVRSAASRFEIVSCTTSFSVL